MAVWLKHVITARVRTSRARPATQRAPPAARAGRAPRSGTTGPGGGGGSVPAVPSVRPSPPSRCLSRARLPTWKNPPRSPEPPRVCPATQPGHPLAPQNKAPGPSPGRAAPHPTPPRPAEDGGEAPGRVVPPFGLRYPPASGPGRARRPGVRSPSLVSSTQPRSPTERGALSVLDRSLVTLIALGRLIDTTGVKRTLEITNKRANYHVDLERASLKIYPLHI